MMNGHSPLSMIRNSAADTVQTCIRQAVDPMPLVCRRSYRRVMKQRLKRLFGMARGAFVSRNLNRNVTEESLSRNSFHESISKEKLTWTTVTA